jgi:hypothetical protein
LNSLKPFLEGLLAGYGIAIPVGGISPVTHHYLPARAQVFVSALGNVLVVGLGARMLLRSFG